ncbi:MAG: hypothetical protein ACTSQY_02615 [Candidatus Odinarchaeia archaeon]
MTKVNVKISKRLLDQIQAQVDQSRGEFNTPEEYIEFVLTEILKDEEEEKLSPEEEEAIKNRLRALGYIE